MKAVTQQDLYGCAVACVAFVLKISYLKSLSLFVLGKKKAATVGFYCKEIVSALKKKGLNYKLIYVGGKNKKNIYKNGTIVFIKKSKKYYSGHYLCRFEGKWMDSWINFPYEKRQAGFRKRLPGKLLYAISHFKN